MASIVNTTAVFDLGNRVSLREVANIDPGITFNPHKHNAAIYRSSGYTAQIFESGKVVLIGCKSEYGAREAQTEIIEKLCNSGIYVHHGEIQMTNYVIALNVGQPLDLVEIAEESGASYTPELFNAMFLKLSNCTAVLFHTGKVHLTGVKRLIDVEEALSELSVILRIKL